MSEYNVDTLENKIVVEAQEALKQLDQIIGNVNKAKSSIESMKNATGLKSIDKEAKQATSSLTKLQAISQNLKKALNFSGLIYGAKKIYDLMQSSAKNSIDYVETLNLFEVSTGKTIDAYGNIDKVASQYYTKALNFQNRLNEAFGTNIEETMRYQALYNQMTKSMGVGNNASYIISENLTKLGIDLSSLFNKEEVATMEALRAGVLAGQTKPLRNYGLDVTQQSLKPLLASLGIDRNISELSQAEKMILRYIAVLRQASAAHGDFAKTIESPANQLKVLKSQFEELKTAIGNLFQGLLGQVLPYVNAVIMVIKELVKMIGSLFGFTVSSSNSNLANITGVEELDTGLSSAAGSAKALKAQLMGFDEINNITTETSSGGGGGSISSTGIDQRLLDALGEYDNLMDKVRMKATDIKDRIMEWLGFTGDVEHDTKRVKEILDLIATVLEVIGVTWLSTKIIGAIGGIINGLGAGGVLGITNKLSFAVAGLATSWGLAKIAANKYVDYFKNEDVASLTQGIGGQVGSILAGAGAGAVIGGPIGALSGALLTSGTSMLQSYSAAQNAAISDLEQQMIDSFEEFKESARRALYGSATGDDTYNLDVYDKFTQQYKDINTSDFWYYPEKNKQIEEMIEKYRNLALAEVQLFDNGGIKIDEYYKKYVNMVNGITASSDTWASLYSSYSANNDKLQEVSDSLDIFTTKLGNGAYKVTADDISKLNTILAEMSSYVKASGDAFVDAAISSTNSLKDEQYISTETADKVVANAIRKANAEGNAFETYKLKLQDYTTQLEKGMITQKEYNTLVGNAKAEYEKAKKGADATETSVKYLNERIGEKLDLKNWDEAIDYTKQLGQLYTDNADKLKTNYDAELQYYNEQIAWTESTLKAAEEAYGIESEQYKEIQSELEALKETRSGVTKQYEDDIVSLKKTMYESLKIIENQLIESGYDIDKDAKGIYKSVQDQLNKIGLDTEIANNIDKELSKLGKTLDNSKPTLDSKAQSIRNALKNAIGENYEVSPLVTLKPTVSIVTTGATSAIKTFNDAVSVSLENRSAAINKLSGMNRTQFKAYASGGFPSLGEFFMAREAGPELVGRIGRRTAVANNAQIVEAVSRGVYEAVSAAMPGGSTVSLDIRADEGIIVKKAVKGINEFVTQTGELPFPVPV